MVCKNRQNDLPVPPEASPLAKPMLPYGAACFRRFNDCAQRRFPPALGPMPPPFQRIVLLRRNGLNGGSKRAAPRALACRYSSFTSAPSSSPCRTSISCEMGCWNEHSRLSSEPHDYSRFLSNPLGSDARTVHWPADMKSAASLTLCALLAGSAGTGIGWWLGQDRREEAAGRRRVILAAGGDPVSGGGREAEKERSALTASLSALEKYRRILTSVESVGPGGFEAALRRCMVARRMEPVGEEAMAWRILWMRWAELEPEAALAASLKMDPEGEATAAVILSVTRRNPKLAQALLEAAHGAGRTSLLDGMQGAQLAGTVAREWWRQDREAALAWVKGLPEGVRDHARGAVVAAAALDDPPAAAVMAAQMPAGHEREVAAARVAEMWATHSPAEAMAWVRTLAAEDRRRAEPQALIAWAAADGEQAAQFVSSESMDSAGASPHRLSEDVQRNVAAVAGTWAKREPDKAAEWMAKLPEGPLKSEAMEHVLWHWTEAAPEESSRWLDAQPPGPARDAGMAMLSQHTAATDPAAATAWAAAMTPGLRRDAALQQALAAWLRKDHTAASAWVEGK